MAQNIFTDRQYPLTVFYAFGSPLAPNMASTDATAPVIINLPPGAQVVSGFVNVTKVGTVALTVMDNATAPTSLFGSVVTTALGVTQAVELPFYPAGATLTVAPNAASANIIISYVIDDRANEQSY